MRVCVSLCVCLYVSWNNSVYLKNTKQSTEKLLDIIRELTNVAIFKKLVLKNSFPILKLIYM